jgi:DDB1- and CUL4-associated factor 7
MEENCGVTYAAPWQMYAFGFSNSSAMPLTMALGSFVKSQFNCLQVVRMNEEMRTFEKVCQAEQVYPATKVMWAPEGDVPLIAASGDALKIWNFDGNSLTLRANLLTDSKKEYPPPQTSLDWNKVNTNIVGTCSINTTCTIWDIEKEVALTHMIAHDQAVYDIAFSNSVNLFATAGGDGSIRQFDLRNLENSAVLYEKQDISACLRIAWNKHDPCYLATIMLESSAIVVLDIRQNSVPVYTLNGHANYVNALAWSPVNGTQLLTGADDHRALIWNVQPSNYNIEPSFVYSAEAEVNNVGWAQAWPEWIALGKSQEISVLRI